MTFERIAFDVDAVTGGVIETVADQAYQKNFDMLAHIKSEVPAGLMGNPFPVRQILMNVVGEAIKFIDYGQGLLTVEYDIESENAGALHFIVSDTGVGILANKLEEGFASFLQAGSSTTRRYDGTGIGLPIAKQLVTLLGGRIWAESEVGKDSIFHFTIFSEVGRISAQQRRWGERSDLSKLWVFVVDDNATNRLILRQTLNSLGAEVREASNAVSALKELQSASERREQFDLILLDGRMPDVDGFELARRIDEHGLDGPHLLMLTFEDLASERGRLKEVGLGTCLIKPLRRSGLIEEISAALSKRGLIAPQKPTVMQTLEGLSLFHDGKGKRALLADDNASNQILIQRYLRESQCRIEIIEDEQATTKRFTTNQCDLVIMDVNVPVMDGLEATRVIRKTEHDEDRESTPAIVHNASALQSDVQLSLEAGANLDLSKPIRKDARLKAIERIPGLSLEEGAEDGKVYASAV